MWWQLFEWRVRIESVKPFLNPRSFFASVRFSSAAFYCLVFVTPLACSSEDLGSEGGSGGDNVGVAVGGQTSTGVGGQDPGAGGLASGGIGSGGDASTNSGGGNSVGGTTSGTGGIGSGGGTSVGGTASGTGGIGSGGDSAAGGNTSAGGDSGTGGDSAAGGDSGETCPLPTAFQWTSTGPLAEPKNAGAKSLKDFSVTKYNGKYIVYATTADGDWNGFMSTFTSFDEWASAEQKYIPGLVAPTIFYFAPKDVWVLAYQWSFKYSTSTTPDDPQSWSQTKSLINGDPTGGRGTGPIDQTIICDDSDCYIFFNDDAGGVYRGSMPIDQFPGQFNGITRIMDQPTSVIFEGIQVYSIKGSDKYLMIIENDGTRFFRAWTADALGGTWTPLAGASTTQAPFAGEANVTWPDGKWTNDISHGDLVREDPSEKMMIDPCNLQLLYQGRDPNAQGSYENRPYRPGLLTLQK